MGGRVAPLAAVIFATWTLTGASAPQPRFVRYFGGSSTDNTHAMAVDAQRNIYIAGYTTSPELLAALPLPEGTTFPLPANTAFPFLAKFDSRGQLVYLRGLTAGDSTRDRIRLAVDVSGSVYVTGQFNAPPSLVSYLAKFDSTGTPVFFKTLHPGDGVGIPNGLAVNARGEAVAVGGDAYVLKFTARGDIMWLQHLGTDTGSTATAVAVDAAGSIYVTGETNVSSFPATGGSVQPRLAPGSCVDPRSSERNPLYIPCTDAFIAKLNLQGSIVYASFLGGARNDVARTVAVDRTGAATIAGYSESSDLPTVNAAQPKCAQLYVCRSMFIAKVDPTGSRLVYATYYDSPSGSASGLADAATDSLGNAYIVGSTGAKDWPIVNPMQPSYGDGPLFASSDGGESWTQTGGAVAAYNLYRIFWPGGRATLYGWGDLGVFRSTNGGASWSPLAIDGGRLYYVIVDPVNPAIVYGTPDSNLSNFGARLYKSLDGGQAWTRLPLPADCRGSALVISPAQPWVIYRGGSNVCRSDDGGSTWRTVFTATASMISVEPFAADPRNVGTVYGVAVNQSYRHSLVKTTDGGGSWKPIGELPRVPPNDAYEAFPRTLHIDPGEPQTLFVTVTGGIVRSRDGGMTWDVITGAPNTPPIARAGTYVLAHDAVPPHSLYAAGVNEGLYRSDDRGTHWQRVKAPFPSIQQVAASNGRLLLKNSGGADGFLVALDPYGSVLTSTYIGGAGADSIVGIRITADDVIAIAGTTSSSYWPLAGGAEREYRGGSDAFLMQLVRDPAR